jgi:hypothetical protein
LIGWSHQQLERDREAVARSETTLRVKVWWFVPCSSARTPVGETPIRRASSLAEAEFESANLDEGRVRQGGV